MVTSDSAVDEVLVDDAVAGGEEGQDVLDKVLFALLEAFPVVQVLGQVGFLDGPEGRFGLFVHLPDLRVLDRQDNEAVGVVAKQGLHLALLVGERHVVGVRDGGLGRDLELVKIFGHGAVHKGCGGDCVVGEHLGWGLVEEVWVWWTVF